MQIFAQGQQIHTVDVSQETTVQDLKILLCQVEGIPTDEQVLSFGGVPLENELIISELIPPLSTVSVSAKVLGGKVHGSLARAGKVRGQTPKVDKQEKKKKRTGRAKRRMQYNRRFVNVVQTFGRRKGPNSNAP